MGTVRHFTDLLVWQRAHGPFQQIAKLVDGFPKTPAARVITDQILRSSGSIGANISEGFAAASTREYLHFLDIAKRTTNETENWLRNIAALNLAAQVQTEALIADCDEIRRMLGGLKNSLKAKMEP